MQQALDQLTKARRLADTGHHAALVGFLTEAGLAEIEKSPSLAFMFGTAKARLGEFETGRRWVEIALHRSRVRGDRSLELRSLNVLGAIAFEVGNVADAVKFFAQGIDAANRDNDYGGVGRCSNNLGIVENMRGQYAKATGSFSIAIGAFGLAGLARGVAEAHHNLGITYHDQGEFQFALEAADRAVHEADEIGDAGFRAKTLAGRAEIRVALGDSVLAQREVEHAIATHRDLGDEVGESEDLRILAAAVGATGDSARAEALLRDVITRGGGHGRPLLRATAGRDLAVLLARLGREDEARSAAWEARVLFERLGAEAEVQKLEDW